MRRHVDLSASADPVEEALMRGHPAGGAPGNPVDRVFPHPVPKNCRDGDFLDRQHELAIAQAVLSQTTRKPLLVRGERCIGKTSLLNRIRRWLELPPQSERFRTIAIEPGGLASWQEFAQELWDGVLRCVEEAGEETPAHLRVPRGIRTFGSYLGDLRRLLACLPDVTLVIFLDELDKIRRHADSLQQTKILSLIRHVVESEDLPLAFVISVLRELPGQEGLGSPLAVEEIVLHPLEMEDARAMVEAVLGSQAYLTSEALGWLYRVTGGHPYFLKLLLAMACDALEPGVSLPVLAAEDLRRAVSAAGPARRKQLNDVLQSVYREYLNDSEREVLLWLTTRAEGSLRAEELQAAPGRLRAATETLIERGYLLRAPDGGCRLRLAWLRDWLRSWPEYQSEVERLRGLIQAAPPLQIADGILIDRVVQNVWVDGKLIRDLTALEYRALVCLTERVGQVVAKDELFDQIYPEDLCDASDGSLHSLIYRLRKALGDDGRPPKYIETVRGRGFRIRSARFISSL